MCLLKKENWFMWLIINVISMGFGIIGLFCLMDCVRQDAWYMKWYYWLLAFCFFFFPFSIMIIVFLIEMMCEVASKLDLPGKEIYLTPYIWLILLIIPFIGWIGFTILGLYLEIGILYQLSKGKAEKYIIKL